MADPARPSVEEGTTSLPATLVIGAAGHRKIGDGPRLEEAIASVIRDIGNLVPWAFLSLYFADKLRAG
ncbi:MAG TPA: hypothetical protein VHP61_00805, partial [Acidobacteriota bacterium]|nr:hypothetical protein [Acidobacteriota bacterium]